MLPALDRMRERAERLEDDLETARAQLQREAGIRQCPDCRGTGYTAGEQPCACFAGHNLKLLIDERDRLREAAREFLRAVDGDFDDCGYPEEAYDVKLEALRAALDQGATGE